jgi:uncharacterized protein (DUF433 family)
MTERKKVFRQLRLAIPEMAEQINWTGCPDVESVPDRCSGAWVVKGTRIMVQGILDNAQDFTAEQIASEIFEGINRRPGAPDFGFRPQLAARVVLQVGAAFEAINTRGQLQKVTFPARVGLDELAHDGAQRNDFVLDGARVLPHIGHGIAQLDHPRLKFLQRFQNQCVVRFAHARRLSQQP